MTLADAIRNEPVVLAHLVRVSELTVTLQPLAEGLARRQWSDAQLRAFEERLRAVDLLADVDFAAVACALERFHLARGRWPDSLGALVPEFINHLPTDVITGQPLKYSLTEDGEYVLYSVGWNETDDGGTPSLRDNGHQVENSTGDWVWRLPAQRGQ